MIIKKIREKFKPKRYFTNGLHLNSIPSNLLGRIRIEEIELEVFKSAYECGLQDVTVWTCVNMFDDDIEQRKVEDVAKLKFGDVAEDVLRITGIDQIYVAVLCRETGEISYRFIHFDRVVKEKIVGLITQLYDVRAGMVVDGSPVSIVGVEDETEQFDNIQMMMFEMNV